MLVADLVIETLPGMAPAVGERMGRINGMAGVSAEGDHRIHARWTVQERHTLEGLSEVLQAMNPEIVEVFSTLRDDDS
jgi:hypothetical protein